MPDTDCLCWVGHGDCGGCSGVIGIAHEPACGWEQNPDCPVHGALQVDNLPEDHVPSPSMQKRLGPDSEEMTTLLGSTRGQMRKVRKSRTTTFGPPWIVTNHPLGPLCFDTWQQAMDYANGPRLVIANFTDEDLDAVRKEITNLALYGESTSTIRSSALHGLAGMGHQDPPRVIPLADGRNQITVHDHHAGS